MAAPKARRGGRWATPGGGVEVTWQSLASTARLMLRAWVAWALWRIFLNSSSVSGVRSLDTSSAVLGWVGGWVAVVMLGVGALVDVVAHVSTGNLEGGLEGRVGGRLEGGFVSRLEGRLGGILEDRVGGRLEGVLMGGLAGMPSRGNRAFMVVL